MRNIIFINTNERSCPLANVFSIFINDIPTLFNKNKSYSLLLADDLVTLFIFKKSGKLESMVRDYMKKLETWLN
jgi:hypothetical protein